MALVTVHCKCCNLNKIFRRRSIILLCFSRVLLENKNLHGQKTRRTSKFTNRTNNANRMIFKKITVAMD